MSAIRDALTDLFDDYMSDEEVLEIWNNYAEEYSQPMMFRMNDIESRLMTIEGMSLLEILESVHPRYFDPLDEFFTVAEDGTIYSFSDWYGSPSPFARNELFTAIIDDDSSFGNDKLRRLLDQFDI